MMLARQQQEAALRQQQQGGARPLYPSSFGAGGAGLAPQQGLPLQQQQQPPQRSSFFPPQAELTATGAGSMMTTHNNRTFVTSLTENDVLLGRGTPCAENEGNVRFRKLVRSRKAEYTAAEKRMRKDAIAREVLDVIAARGGKFLRKVESKAEMMQLGIPLCTGGVTPKEVWAIVDEDTQVQKVKQALRNKDDIGPVMERDDDEEDDDVQRLTSSPTGTASTGSKGTYTDRDVTNRFPKGVVTNSSHNHDDKIDSSAEGKIMFGGGAPRSGGLEQVGKGSPDKSKGSPEKGKFVLDSPTKKKSLPP